MNNELWRAIYDLFSLLRENNLSERDYQHFFEMHQIVFGVLGFSSAASFEKSSGNRLPFDEDRGYQPEPDFICARRDTGELVVFEIKTPVERTVLTSRSDGQREKLKADVESYVSQTTEYVEFLQGNKEARESAAKTLGVTRTATYSGILVYGISTDEELVGLTKLVAGRTPRIQLIFFDQLFDMLVNALALTRSDITMGKTLGSGLVFAAVMELPKHQYNDNSIIADLGETGHSRLVVKVSGEYLRVEVNSECGSFSCLECGIPIEEKFFFKIEISSDPEKNFALLTIGRDEVDLRQMTKGREFRPDLFKFALGGDQTGEYGSCLRVFSSLYRDTLFTLQERLETQLYFETKIGDDDTCLEFNGGSFMIRRIDGHMEQVVAERRPILRRGTDPWFGAS